MTEIQKAAKWVCVEIATQDASALPGQTRLMPIAVLARKGNDVRHIPLEGAESHTKQTTLEDMAANATTSKNGSGLFEYLHFRGVGAYSSCSEEFLIEASGWDALLDQLRQRGFPASKEL